MRHKTPFETADFFRQNDFFEKMIHHELEHESEETNHALEPASQETYKLG